MSDKDIFRTNVEGEIRVWPAQVMDKSGRGENIPQPGPSGTGIEKCLP